MALFLEPTDLLTLHPDLSAAAADLICEVVTASIRAGVQWDVTEVIDAVYVATPPYGHQVRRILLPARHVTEATVRRYDEDTDLTEEDDYRLFPEQGVVELRHPWGHSVTVTYTAGWPPEHIPDVFRSVALEYAGPLAANPDMVTSYQMGSTGETLAKAIEARASEDPRLHRYNLGGTF